MIDEVFILKRSQISTNWDIFLYKRYGKTFWRDNNFECIEKSSKQECLMISAIYSIPIYTQDGCNWCLDYKYNKDFLYRTFKEIKLVSYNEDV